MTIDPGGVLNAIDGLGYTFLCLATLFAAAVFGGTRLQRWIHWLLLANTASALPILLTYFVDRTFLVVAGPLWMVSVPGAAILVAVLSRRWRGA